MSTQSTSLNKLYGDQTSESYFMMNEEPIYEWTPNLFQQQNNNKPPEKTVEYFKTDKHIFQAVIQQQINGFTVKICGKSYDDCINISIYIDEQGNPIHGKLSHIQSELECSFDSILKENDTVHFLSASLQFCKEKFPGIDGFDFDDMSMIDCGSSKNIQPPRRFEKPFSLAHFTLAKYGKTWYEMKFGARMTNDTCYTIYREHTTIFDQPIQMSFDEFIRKSFCSPKQIPILNQYFSPSKTWHDFFKSIPKHIQCDALFNWLPDFINNRLNGTYHPTSWVIDADKIPPTPIQMNVKPQYGGRKKTRRTRSRGQYRIILTNKPPMTMNFRSMSV